MNFNWPWHYDFPPFFTIQPNLSTREKQLKAWGRLVLDYCQFNKIYTLDLEEVANLCVGIMATLHTGRLDETGIRAVFDFLEQQKHVEWKDKTKNRCNIYWRRPEEWGQLVYEWANSIGYLNTVVTLYELIRGEEAAQESFYGLDKDVLLKGLQHLEEQGKAVLIDIDGEKGGVKFLMSAVDFKGSNFLKNSDKIEEGDTVIIYANQGAQNAIVVKRGCTLHMKYGALRHEFLIGKLYGVPISATAGYVYALRVNPALWTKTLPKKTQILYTPDIGTILLLMDVKPGAIVCETGTGSGSLTHALATAVAPDGHVYSHDIDAGRVAAVQNDIKLHGLAECATVLERDVCQDGFAATDCDAIFLDLPSPWLALEHARRAINPGNSGRLVSFSPCIEQVQKVVEMLEQLGFVEIETIEVVSQKLKVVEVVSESLAEMDVDRNKRGGRRAEENAKKEEANQGEQKMEMEDSNSPPSRVFLDAQPYPPVQPTHTGYLTSATLLPQFGAGDFGSATGTSTE